jgi:alpha-L-rhamnosidase
VGDVTSAEATLHTVLGSIVSRWKLANGRLVYDVEIPPNTKAQVLLPGGAREIASGSHHFDVPYPERR